MVCKNCGKEVKEGTKFCTDCGAPVQPEPQATYNQPNYQQPPQQQYQQQYAQPLISEALLSALQEDLHNQ